MKKVTPTTESGQLVKASARQLRIAPRKMRLVTNLIKGMSVNNAVIQLQHTNKKGADMVIKLLRSAVANAQNNFSLSPDKLFIKTITTDMGAVMTRYFPRARGSAFPIRRKMCHVNVVLEEKGGAKASRSKFDLFKKKAEASGQSKDGKETVAEKPVKDLGKKSQVFKTEEQVKANKVANKRRLFNRKSGE